MRSAARLGFRVADRDIRNDIFVPRYYDPEIDELLGALSQRTYSSRSANW